MFSGGFGRRVSGNLQYPEFLLDTWGRMEADYASIIMDVAWRLGPYVEMAASVRAIREIPLTDAKGERHSVANLPLSGRIRREVCGAGLARPNCKWGNGARPLSRPFPAT